MGFCRLSLLRDKAVLMIGDNMLCMRQLRAAICGWVSLSYKKILVSTKFGICWQRPMLQRSSWSTGTSTTTGSRLRHPTSEELLYPMEIVSFGEGDNQANEAFGEYLARVRQKNDI